MISALAWLEPCPVLCMRLQIYHHLYAPGVSNRQSCDLAQVLQMPAACLAFATIPVFSINEVVDSLSEGCMSVTL